MAITQTRGLPSAADLKTFLDALGAIHKGQYSNIGLFGDSETTTLAGLARLADQKIMGDGATYYGLANADMQRICSDPLRQFRQRARYDDFFGQLRAIFTQADSLVAQNIPSGWVWSSSSGSRALDLWIQYLNATSPSAPVTPTFTPSLTGTTGGAIGQSGATRIKCCYQNLSSHWLVSQASAASSSITLSGKNNAITFTPAGNSPITGYLLVFRQALGSGAGDPYYFDQRVSVTSGAAHPAITCTLSDQQLKLDLSPPSWLSCPILPEEAFLFALAYASPSLLPGAIGAMFTYQSAGMASPCNTTLNPVYLDASLNRAFLGINNQPAGSLFGQWVGGSGYTEGTLDTANDAGDIVQGFAGAMGSDLRLRVTSVLNNNAGITNLRYYYFDAANPPSGAGTNATISPGTLNLGSGQTLDLGIASDRLVTRVDQMTVGTATTGTFVVESKPCRSI